MKYNVFVMQRHCSFVLSTNYLFCTSYYRPGVRHSKMWRCWCTHVLVSNLSPSECIMFDNTNVLACTHHCPKHNRDARTYYLHTHILPLGWNSLGYHQSRFLARNVLQRLGRHFMFVYVVCMFLSLHINKTYQLAATVNQTYYVNSFLKTHCGIHKR